MSCPTTLMVTFGTHSCDSTGVQTMCCPFLCVFMSNNNSNYSPFVPVGVHNSDRYLHAHRLSLCLPHSRRGLLLRREQFHGVSIVVIFEHLLENLLVFRYCITCLERNVLNVYDIL